MFYRTNVSDHIRVPPKLFELSVEEAIIQKVRDKFSGFIDKEIGIIIDVLKVGSIGRGVIIPGDGATYYEVDFELLAYKPEQHEVVFGKVKDVADFGAFMNIGPIEGMIHISQTMDDFVSFSKDKTLTGKESKKVLKVGDLCRARIIAISFKDITNPKIGLTMRQQNLGRLDWIEEEKAAAGSKGEKKKK